MIILQPVYNRKLAANNNMPVPEWRLPPVIVGGVAFGLGQYTEGYKASGSGLDYGGTFETPPAQAAPFHLSVHGLRHCHFRVWLTPFCL